MEDMIVTPNGYSVIPLFHRRDISDFKKKTGLKVREDFAIHYVIDYEEIDDFLADHGMTEKALEDAGIDLAGLFATITVYPRSIHKIVTA